MSTITEPVSAPSESTGSRPLETITPPEIFQELRRGVLGQDRALRFVSVAVYKHVTGRQPGNLLMIGNSGTGKTTIMNNIQRLYTEVPEYHRFRAVTILNANLLVDPDRLELRPDRLMAAVEQRARAVVGERATPEALRDAMENATVCIDEVDKMSTVLGGKPNPLGVVLQQGLLTLMEGEIVTWESRVFVDGEEKLMRLDIDTSQMMFICGGAFEGLYDLVRERVEKPGGGVKLKTQTVRAADGRMRIETRFHLAELMQPKDLFDYGMVPQFMARFEKTVVLEELTRQVLEEILLEGWDSPYRRARNFFEMLGIELQLESAAAALVAEVASRDSRTGARALRPALSEILNPLEFDPWSHPQLEDLPEGRRRLVITLPMVKESLKN
ncbi:MAG: AAA family ATPase [Acidobacteriota bacterium]